MIHMVMAQGLDLVGDMVVMTISLQEILLTATLINPVPALALVQDTTADRIPARVPMTTTLMAQEASTKVNWIP